MILGAAVGFLAGLPFDVQNVSGAVGIFIGLIVYLPLAVAAMLKRRKLKGTWMK